MKKLVYFGLCGSIFLFACGTDKPPSGDTPAGDTGPGDAATGDTATGDTATGDTATGDTATGDTATGDTGIGGPCVGQADGIGCGLDKICVQEACLTPRCGDGVRSLGNGADRTDEDCDDANDVAFDGCEADCTFSCVDNADCNDSLQCNGSETCDQDTHKCAPGTAPDCDDTNACTEDLCSEVAGCTNRLIDVDKDGYAPTTLGACGSDCDDTDKTVYAGAEELCDGVDNNCNGDTDETAPSWYKDCDGDGFAPNTLSSVQSCSSPSPVQGCPGGWTPTRPVGAINTDCNDDNVDMFPGQTAFFSTPHSSGPDDDAKFGSYDCNGIANRSRRSTVANQKGCIGSAEPITKFVCSGSGWDTTAPACGNSASYVTCDPNPEECFGKDCGLYKLTCVGARANFGDPCYCEGPGCLLTCTPGTANCPWHWYRCTAPSTQTTTMSCR